MQVANANNKCFIVWRNEINGRFDPLFLNYKKQKNNYKFDLVKLSDLLEEKPQYGANEIAIDGNPQTDIRYIRITDIDEFGNLKKDSWQTAETVEGKYLLEINDLLFARSGATAGKTFLYKKEWGKAIFAGYLIKFKINERKANPEFIFYYTQLKPYAEWIKSIQRPSGQPNINSEEFKELEIPLPPLETQNKIVEIMQSAYDKKADKEKEAENILNSIDDYILEELDIKIPEAQDKKCFYINSQEVEGKRLDPKGYLDTPQTIIKAIKKSKNRTKILSELIETSIAGEWGEEPTLENNGDYCLVKVLRNTNFDNQGNLNFDDVAERLIENKKLEKVKLRKGDILIEKSGGSPIQPVGRVALIESLKEKFTFSNFLQCFRVKDEILPEYLFCFLRALYGLNYMEYLQNQTTGIKNLIMEEYLSIPIPLPPIQIQKQLASEFKNRLENANKLKSGAKNEVEKAKQEVEKIILGDDD